MYEVLAPTLFGKFKIETPREVVTSVHSSKYANKYASKNVRVPPSLLGGLTLPQPQPDIQAMMEKLARAFHLKAAETRTEIVESSLVNKFRSNVIEIEPHNPFYGTGLIVFRDAYDGPMPPNGIMNNDFTELCTAFTNLLAARTNIQILGSLQFQKLVHSLLKTLCTRVEGRTLFYSILRHRDKTLRISPPTDIYKTNLTVFKRTHQEATIYLCTKQFQVFHRTRSDNLFGQTIPMFITLAHEMIHAQHIFDSGNINEFRKRIRAEPTRGKHYSNLEEEETIAAEEGDRISENAIRRAFGLPLRDGHQGTIARPEHIDVTLPSTQDYFLKICNAGFTREVQELLGRGMDPNVVVASDQQKMTPIMYAAVGGRGNIVSLLLGKGADRYRLSGEGLSLKYYVIRSGDVNFAEYMVQNRIVHLFPREKVSTPFLVYAIQQLKDDCGPMVRYLMANGVDPFEKNSLGQSALHAAACLKDTRLFYELEGLGLSRDVQDSEGLKPIHHALRAGNWPLVEALCQTKEDFFQTTPCGKSLLFYAMWSGKAQVVSSLRALGLKLASPEELQARFLQGDYAGNKPIDFAFKNAFDTAGQDFIRYLISKGLAISPNQFSNFVSLYATEEPGIRRQMLEVVYKHNWQIDQPYCFKQSLLSWAVRNNDVDLAEYALSKGATINTVVNGLNPTPPPLHQAVLNGNAAMVRLLLQHGADSFQPDSTGAIPLMRLMNFFLSDTEIDLSICDMLIANMSNTAHNYNPAIMNLHTYVPTLPPPALPLHPVLMNTSLLA